MTLTWVKQKSGWYDCGDWSIYLSEEYRWVVRCWKCSGFAAEMLPTMLAAKLEAEKHHHVHEVRP